MAAETEMQDEPTRMRASEMGRMAGGRPSRIVPLQVILHRCHPQSDGEDPVPLQRTVAWAKIRLDIEVRGGESGTDPNGNGSASRFPTWSAMLQGFGPDGVQDMRAKVLGGRTHLEGTAAGNGYLSRRPTRNRKANTSTHQRRNSGGGVIAAEMQANPARPNQYGSHISANLMRTKRALSTCPRSEQASDRLNLTRMLGPLSSPAHGHEKLRLRH